MTGEEMERAIEFLLQSQANHQVRLDELTAQVSETNKQLEIYAKTQSEFIEIVTKAMTNLADAQARTERTVNETNAQLARTDAQLAQTAAQLARTDAQLAQTAAQLAQTDAQLSQTDERLNRLVRLFEQHITVGH